MEDGGKAVYGIRQPTGLEKLFQTDYGNLKQDEVVCISFAYDLSNWLKVLCDNVPAGAEHVFAVLKQYQKLVAKLTGEMLMDKEITEKLITKDNFESAVAIARNLKNAKTEILRRVLANF